MPRTLSSPLAVCWRTWQQLLSLALLCVYVFHSGFSEHASSFFLVGVTVK